MPKRGSNKMLNKKMQKSKRTKKQGDEKIIDEEAYQKIMLN